MIQGARRESLTYDQASAGNGFRGRPVPIINNDNDKNLDIVKSMLCVNDEEVSTGFLDCSGLVDSSEKV